MSRQEEANALAGPAGDAEVRTVDASDEQFKVRLPDGVSFTGFHSDFTDGVSDLVNAFNTFASEKPPFFNAVLQIALDAVDGVKTVFVDPSKQNPSVEFPTGYAYVRDACNATPTVEHDGRVTRAKIAMFQRTFQTMRAVLYDPSEKLPVLKTLNAFINKHYRELLTFDYNDLDAIEAQEIAFNTLLIAVLIKTSSASMTTNDHAKLLAHYRDLSSVLDPAVSVVTVTQYEMHAGEKYYHLEQAHPITQKTEKQKNEINSIRGTDYLSLATETFKGLIQKDDRRLPAQSRKHIAIGVKNGYVTESKHYTVGSDGQIRSDDEKTYQDIRHGSLTYVGKQKLTKDELIAYTKDNIEQLELAYLQSYSGTPLHITILLTDCSIQKQDRILDCAREAIDQLNAGREDGKKIILSNIAVNIPGVFYNEQLASEVYRKLSIGARLRQGLSHVIRRFLGPLTNIFYAGAMTIMGSMLRRWRYHDAVDLPALVEQGHTTSISCASGQDRTGTVHELKEIKRIVKHSKGVISFDEAAYTHAAGGHNVVLASAASPGSPGLKRDSHVTGLFPEKVNALLYRQELAKTNKARPVGSCAEIEEVMSQLDTHLMQSHRLLANNRDIGQLELDETFRNYLQEHDAKLKPFLSTKNGISKALAHGSTGSDFEVPVGADGGIPAAAATANEHSGHVAVSQAPKATFWAEFSGIGPLVEVLTGSISSPKM